MNDIIKYCHTPLNRIPEAMEVLQIFCDAGFSVEEVTREYQLLIESRENKLATMAEFGEKINADPEGFKKEIFNTFAELSADFQKRWKNGGAA